MVRFGFRSAYAHTPCEVPRARYAFILRTTRSILKRAQSSRGRVTLQRASPGAVSDSVDGNFVANYPPPISIPTVSAMVLKILVAPINTAGLTALSGWVSTEKGVCMVSLAAMTSGNRLENVKSAETPSGGIRETCQTTLIRI